MKTLRLAATILLLAATAAEAQKNCKKGIPCGGTCIAANKTCHVGSASPTPATSPAVAATAAQVASKSDTTGEWIGSSAGHTYYRAGCSGAKALKPTNVIHFKTEADAKTAGYTRSAQKGC
jgi:hypothetical protein